jgi:3'-phosphoadenosine 5'-phosphosulfate sulfotransferase (PAPS reductase)/FAD synthetase
MTTFYNFSGGMESAAMLVVDRARINEHQAVVCFADTGKYFPEMAGSIQQISDRLGLQIVTVPRRLTFDEYLFNRGGMLRKGMNDCSRRMKRSNLKRYADTFQKPWEINIGFNSKEDERADAFSARNERPWCHWRYPLIEAGIQREQTWDICREAGFTVLVGMYEKMGRFDCFWCPNQRPSQAMKVIEYYPELAAEWIAAEDRKGHSFLSIPLRLLPAKMKQIEDEKFPLFSCACFGGDADIFEDDPLPAPPEGERT